MFFYLEVRYTNYVRLRPDEFDTHNEEDVQFQPGNTSTNQRHAVENLLPENDLERDCNEIQYRRLMPAKNLDQQGINPQRIYVSILKLNYIYILIYVY